MLRRSGRAIRGGSEAPELRLCRLYLHQHVPFGHACSGRNRDLFHTAGHHASPARLSVFELLVPLAPGSCLPSCKYAKITVGAGPEEET